MLLFVPTPPTCCETSCWVTTPVALDLKSLYSHILFPGVHGVNLDFGLRVSSRLRAGSSSAEHSSTRHWQNPSQFISTCPVKKKKKKLNNNQRASTVSVVPRLQDGEHDEADVESVKGNSVKA